MATNTYITDVNGQVFAGRFNLPSWVRNQALNTWGVVPTTNVLADLNPRNNPLLNPVFPSKPEWEALGGFSKIVGSWCGANANTDLNELRLALLSGHADYAGGESYGIYLKSENPEFTMLHPPTGALPEAIITDDQQENTGLYANGRARAVHTYNKCIWVPGFGHAVIPQGNCSVGANGGTLRALFFDQISGEMSLFGAAIPTGSPGDYSGGGTCWDESRQCVWVRRAGTGRFHRYFPASNTWEINLTPSQSASGDVAMAYIPEHDCIVWTCSSFRNTGDIGVINCATGQTNRLPISGSEVGMTIGAGMALHRFNQNQFVTWNNTTNTEVINIIQYDTHPITGSWSITQMPVAESNAVTPSVKQSSGTYGRFNNFPKLGIFVLLNSVNESPFFYRYK
jgi:hypothetical protein